MNAKNKINNLIETIYYRILNTALYNTYSSNKIKRELKEVKSISIEFNEAYKTFTTIEFKAIALINKEYTIKELKELTYN